MITDSIKQKIQKAMRDKDEVRVSTFKMLSNALHNALIDKKREALNEDEELDVVRKEAKKRKDAIEAYKNAGADDRAEKEKQELSILEKFLPSQMSDEELARIVDGAIKGTGASDIRDMGKVMSAVMDKTKGRADGKRASELVASKLKTP